MKYVYVALCILGTVVPYYFFVPFVLAHGLNMPLFVRQLMATPVSAFFGADVVMSSVALWAFIAHERRKRPVRLWWLCIIANLGVGVSLALPLFLLLRHRSERTN
ncbi:MAG TPA: DUF2834 domain-containing protein [Thermoanaerobaculia bacterium]|jgi:hypothetical protein|nr:DUF2834 domain-containing protein [Thermoanaerobaculia bacterium]